MFVLFLFYGFVFRACACFVLDLDLLFSKFVVVVLVCCVSFCLLFVIIAHVLYFAFQCGLCLREPVNNPETICCGPSAKSGRQQVGRSSINLTNCVPFLWMRSQSYNQHFRPGASGERGPTLHPHNIITHNPQHEILKIYNKPTIIPRGSFHNTV